jgi:type IV secretion system protein VirB9
MRRVLLSVALVLLSANSAPQSRGIDRHIQHVFYNPDDVVRLTGAIGWQITLEFAPDERIENVSIGDSLAWQVTPNKRAKMLFLKPLTAKASTNMTVITNQRQYAFALATAPRRPSTPWIVRFDYPRAVVETLPEPPAPPQPRLNFAYAKAGDALLLPTRVWDDGRQTYFEFADGVSLPAIFAGGPGKDEALVNVVNQGRVAVVQQTSGRFTLRAGKRFATVTYLPTEARK